MSKKSKRQAYVDAAVLDVKRDEYIEQMRKAINCLHDLVNMEDTRSSGMAIRLELEKVINAEAQLCMIMHESEGFKQATEDVTDFKNMAWNYTSQKWYCSVTRE